MVDFPAAGAPKSKTRLCALIAYAPATCFCNYKKSLKIIAHGA